MRTILRLCFAVLCTLTPASLLFAQGVSNIQFFQSYHQDSPISPTPYGEAALSFADSDHSNTLQIGARGGFPVTDVLQFTGQLSFENISPERGDSESGLSDLDLYGRYLLMDQEGTTISAGGFLSLPIGKEELGASQFNFGPFGAIRHDLQNGVVLAGTLGLFFIETETVKDFFTGETETDYESTLYLGGGVIYTANELINIVSELVIQTEFDYTALSGGIDYEVAAGHIRGALLLGLDDGAPDIQIIGGFALDIQ